MSVSMHSAITVNPAALSQSPPRLSPTQGKPMRTGGRGTNDPDAAVMEKVLVRGIPFAKLTQRETVHLIFGELDRGRGGCIVTSNTDHLRRATRDADFRAILDEADAVVADGMPVVWASRLAGQALPERVAGSTMTLEVAAEAAVRGRSLFLLGGSPGVADAAKAALEAEHPGIRVVGTHCPPMGFEKSREQLDTIREALAEVRPDIVLVALGSPKQEKLIRDLRQDGVLPQAWWMGVGITLSFLAGDVPRAPQWLQQIGFEWVHRLAQEPRRLARRYLIEGITFALGLLARSTMIRATGSRDDAPESGDRRALAEDLSSPRGG
jgi:N-acetylglucosaminyldiphosphoundecaprenol N-acetyl-beta-D-mannosaminyltransferase